LTIGLRQQGGKQVLCVCVCVCVCVCAVCNLEKIVSYSFLYMCKSGFLQTFLDPGFEAGKEDWWRWPNLAQQYVSCLCGSRPACHVVFIVHIPLLSQFYGGISIIYSCHASLIFRGWLLGSLLEHVFRYLNTVNYLWSLNKFLSTCAFLEGGNNFFFVAVLGIELRTFRVESMLPLELCPQSFCF
jgi:hypothetical protein